MERRRRDFERQGFQVAALSFDTVKTLRHFSERVGIHYPLLADPESKVIRAFGLLNETVPADHPFHGIPNPGAYLIDEKGVVQQKFFEEKYSDRFTAGHMLVRALGRDADGSRVEQETDHLYLTTSSSDQMVRPGNRVALVAEVDLKPEMHVYAPGVEGGYIPVEWEIEAVKGLVNFSALYPEAETLYLPAIDETVPVYQGSFRIVADLTLGMQEDLEPLLNSDGDLVVNGSFRYQACDDKMCYLPSTVPLAWRFKVEPLDRTRVPEDLRRGKRAR